MSIFFCAKHIHLKKVNKNHLLKNRKKLKQKAESKGKLQYILK